MSQRFEKIWKFITDDMWHYTAEDAHISPLLLGILKTVYLTVRGIFNKKLTVRAAALTYSSLLAVVPLLAIIFAIARGFGLDDLADSVKFGEWVPASDGDINLGHINPETEEYVEYVECM